MSFGHMEVLWQLIKCDESPSESGMEVESGTEEERGREGETDLR